jgi:hypothetical protein
MRARGVAGRLGEIAICGALFAMRPPTYIKDLSVNSSHLPPAYDRGGKVKESLVAFSKLLISDEQLSESVEPGVGRFHHPASILPRTPSPSSAVSSWNPWYVAFCTDLFANRIAIIAFIRVQESLPAFEGIDDEGIEHGKELTHVMSMGPGNDQ